MTETQKKFITVTTKDVGSNGKPKVLMLNIAHIVVVEPVLWKIHSIDTEGADEMIIEGVNITVSVNVNHIIEVESRDPFDHVLKRIELADGVVQQIGDVPSPQTSVRQSACLECGAYVGQRHKIGCASGLGGHDVTHKHQFIKRNEWDALLTCVCGLAIDA